MSVFQYHRLFGETTFERGKSKSFFTDKGSLVLQCHSVISLPPLKAFFFLGISSVSFCFIWRTMHIYWWDINWGPLKIQHHATFQLAADLEQPEFCRFFSYASPFWNYKLPYSVPSSIRILLCRFISFIAFITLNYCFVVVVNYFPSLKYKRHEENVYLFFFRFRNKGKFYSLIREWSGVSWGSSTQALLDRLPLGLL